MNWLHQLQAYIGIADSQMRWLAAALALCTASGGAVGFLYGWAKGKWDHARKIDRDNCPIVTMCLEKLPSGEILLDVITDHKLHQLHELFGDPKIEVAVKHAVTKCKAGTRLLKSGSTHYSAMDRIAIALTGRDVAATMAKANGRKGDYVDDEMAFYLTCNKGDDGTKMPRILEVPADRLPWARSTDFADNVRFKKQTYKRYLPLLIQMANEAHASDLIFNTIEDEEVAGRTAAVWTTTVTTSPPR